MARKVAIEKTRIGGSKVKTGCQTCKSRRVKCDEAKPSCQRCTKAGRKCEGYMPSPKPQALHAGHKFVHYFDPKTDSGSDRSSPEIIFTPSRTPSPFPDRDPSSLRSLDYYQHSTAARLGEPFGGKFFSNMLIPLMYHNLAIQHSMIALAAFHENYVGSGDPWTCDQRRILALDHYNRSVQVVVQLNIANSSEAILTALVTCLLYSAIESVQGHINSGLKHVASGMRLLAAHQDELLFQELLGQGVSGGFLNQLRLLFISLSFQCGNLEENFVERNVIVLVQSRKALTVENDALTIEQCMSDLTRLMSDVVLCEPLTSECHEQNEPVSTALMRHVRSLELRYDNWCTGYAKLLQQLHKSTPELSLSEQSACLAINVNRITISIILKVMMIPGQTVFDSFRSDFEAVVDLSQEFMEAEQAQQEQRTGNQNFEHLSPSFSLSMGIIPALYLTCSRCRHSTTRHRAAKILSTCQRRESVWDSAPVSSVAQRQIELEESSVRQYWEKRGIFDFDMDDPAFFPEEIRIERVEVGFSEDDDAKISFFEDVKDTEEKGVMFWSPDTQTSHHPSPESN